ncbi:hypothetical protein OGR47_07130 [Methylocystis sp. MJC1]|jgi:hypothetical protein|nr:hypothetical protein [Methylocystis sp. MJC1]KAF2992811.1 hypothetical protein MJC1_00391 [Methylocystis sp. MJC1]MBU6526771.1 hypothetical protein [Methylocystis sp. MJC1]UZX13206.1 hypothetical protein OGR47_07130 [Methylocystis sp. MJC1]
MLKVGAKLAAVIQYGGREGDAALKNAASEAAERTVVEIELEYKGR